MTSHERNFLLPQVEEDDLLNAVLFDDITDPAHRKRWQDFVLSNRQLAREVLKRAYAAAEGSPDLQKIIIDEITYAYAALAAAAIRLSTQESHPVIIGGGADEDQQPLV